MLNSQDQLIFEQGINLRDRALYFSGEIDDNFALETLKRLQILERSSAPITLYISSLGGIGHQSLAVYDMLRASKCPITTVGLGQVCSGATLVFLGGDFRYLYPNCEFMVHQPSVQDLNGTMSEIEKFNAETKLLWGRMVDVYAKTSSKRRSWWNALTTDTYITPKDCLKWGLATKIIEPYDEI